MRKKISHFTDLNAWKKAHELVLSIYQITAKLPTIEKYGLISQMRRCAISITSNIAEGFSRYSYKEKVNFYFIALSSVSELQNQLIVCKDIKYLKTKDFRVIFDKTILVHKIINGLIKRSKSRYS